MEQEISLVVKTPPNVHLELMSYKSNYNLETFTFLWRNINISGHIITSSFLNWKYIKNSSHYSKGTGIYSSTYNMIFY